MKKITLAMLTLAALAACYMPTDPVKTAQDKSAAVDTLSLSVSKPVKEADGRYMVAVTTYVAPSGNVRGYHLPFTLVISDPKGWTFIRGVKGEIYGQEPGFPWGWVDIDHQTGQPYSDHAKMGQNFPTFQTTGSYAIHYFRSNSAFSQKMPKFVAHWGDVILRDQFNGDITEFVLID